MAAEEQTESKRAKKMMDCHKPHTFFKKTDFQGSDIVKGGYSVASASKCCLKCSQHKKCEYWTYGTKGSRKGKCWIKTNMKGKQSQGNRESGYYDPCQDKDNFEDNIDYQGSDLVKGGFSNTTPEKCCAHCIATKGCKYWTFGKNNNKCWVKSNTKGFEHQSNRKSGGFVRDAHGNLKKAKKKKKKKKGLGAEAEAVEAAQAVFAHLHPHACATSCTYIRTYTNCMKTRTPTRACAHTHPCTHAHARTRARTDGRTDARTHAHTRARTHMQCQTGEVGKHSKAAKAAIKKVLKKKKKKTKPPTRAPTRQKTRAPTRPKKKSACKRAGTTKSVGGNGGGWVRSQCRTGKYINHWKLRTGTRLCDNDHHH